MQIVRVGKAREKLAVSNTTLYELVKAGKLPQPIKIAPNCTGFLETDLDAYIDECAKASRGEQQVAK